MRRGGALLLASGAGNQARAQTASAADDAAAMRAFFANTLEIDVPAGDWSAKYFLAANHTYRETGDDGDARGPGWSKTARSARPPTSGGRRPRKPRYCSLGPGKVVGDKWSAPDPVTGNTVFFTLKAGR